MTQHSLFCSAMVVLLLGVIYTPRSLAQAPAPDAPCPKLPGNPASWTDQEHWAWSAICGGHNADLLGKYGGSPSPADSQHWPAQRDLSQRFLETILTNDAYRSRIPLRGIFIVGARFPDEFNLAHVKLDRDLWLLSSQFNALNLVGADFSGHLDFKGSSVTKRVNMDSLHADALSMEGVHFPDLWLATAKIANLIRLNDSVVAGQIQMMNMEVGNDVQMLNSSLNEVILRSVKIGGTLTIAGPKHRGGPPCVTQGAPRSGSPLSVNLTQATIGTLNLGGVCYGPVNAADNWGTGASLILTNASVRTLQDGLCRDNESECADVTWPDHLELNGFNVQQLQGFDDGKETDMADRPASWWIHWLNKQANYSPLPYESIAASLSNLGHKDTATDILYAGKTRELLEATPSWTDKVRLYLLRLLIGFGYRIYYAFWWALALVIAGALVLRLSGEGKRLNMPYGIAYSIDMALPIIHLREAHYEIDLNGYARYYFYFHKTMGFVLASFLIAGLAGLTK
jgi:hypothetical protein